VFAIIGDFTDGGLKEKLQGISGVDYVFVGNQPFESIPDVVAAGDICVLLQDVASEVSQYQIPAKLSDALGMGLVVLLSETAAVADVIESEAVVPVAEGNLAGALGRLLSEPAEMKRLGALGRELFATEFGFEVNISRLAGVVEGVRDSAGLLSEGFDLLWAGFPAVGSVWSGLVSHKTITKGKKIIVYTCNFGNYELVKEPLAVDPRVEYILFTDRKDIKSQTWKVVQINDFPENPRRASRLPKILPNKYLPQHDISVYIDSSLELKTPDVLKMVEECMEGHDIALYKHYERNCVYDEIDFCEKSDIRNVDSVTCSEIRAKYDSINYPKNNGLFENGFIFRKNTPPIKQLNEMWWREYSFGSERDQFTLMYCLWILSIKPHAITIGKECRVNPYVIFTKHTYQHTITDIRLSSTRGVMLIAFGLDYDKISPHLAKTIRLFSDIPIYVCTNLPDFIRSSEWQHISNITFKLFDMHDSENRVIKTQLAQYTIFDETLYIDVDSEVLSANFLDPFKLLRNGISILSPIWKIFSYNGLLEKSKQSNKMKKFLKVADDLGLSGKISFVAGGVCYFKKSECFEIFNDFHKYWIDFGRLEDMPALNKALLQNIDKFKILSNFEYNSTQATVIRSLHSSTMKVTHMENFTRKRYNETQDEWYFVTQGNIELFKKEKFLFIYDVPGWAFYNNSWYVKKYLNQYYEIDLLAMDKIGQNEDISKFIDINEYKAILIHTYSFLRNIPKNFYDKIILGFSSHKRNNFNDFDVIGYRFSNSEDIFNLFDPKFKRYYLPNGVDTNFYFHVCRKLSDNNIRVGCVGSLKWSEHKGKHRVREMCTQARMINKSLFVDPAYALNKNQMLRYYNEIDIFIVSSVSETGPSPLLEAMSCGLVCISNKVGLATKLIKHGFNGFLVDDYNDISAYVKYLEILKNDRELYRLMSLRNKEIISQFDWSVMSINYKIMLDEIVTLLD
ncbi:glycosyltransferase, partial [Limnospira platensis]|uniref:glycosyltransferase n=1 Tax=Limnospira platensis TaxID=118562 RepID=UPI003D6DEED0